MLRTPVRRPVDRPAPRAARPFTGGAPAGTVPYDYAATFDLTGRSGNTVQSVINIGPDGLFVAVAIGYGFEERRERPVPLRPSDSPLLGATPAGSVTLDQFPALALIEGVRIAPRFDALALTPEDPRRPREFNPEPLSPDLLDRAFERIAAPGEVSFLLSMVDTASGRELQDSPVHNLASLGSPDGERPFRLFARPIPFAPRSTIRLQVTEQSPAGDGVVPTIGTLFVVLYGYKIEAACAPPRGAAFPRGPFPPGRPAARSIPFDYVTRFRLTGRPGNEVVDEIAIEAGDYAATSIGYGLMVEDLGVTLRDRTGLAMPDPVNLQNLALGSFPPEAWLDGVRVRPDLVRFAFDNAGSLSTAVPLDLAQRLFVRLNRPEAVSFRYAFFDSGTGRELQNQSIFNIAGLGAADGDRPFKRLARPLRFQPGSTLRVTITERFGRGELFLVFQGHRFAGGKQ